MTSTQGYSSSMANNENRFHYLKEIVVDFTRPRPDCKLQIKLKDGMETQYESKIFGEAERLQWNCEIYVKSPSMATITIQRPYRTLKRACIAKVQLDFGSIDLRENDTAERTDVNCGIIIKLTFGTSGQNINVARLLTNRAVSVLATKIDLLEKMEKVLGYLELVVKLGISASEVHPYAKSAVSGVDTVFQNFQRIPTCHREFVTIMDDIVLMVPLLESLHGRIEDEAVQETLKSFISFIDGVSRDLIEYSSGSKPRFVLQNWYKSKQNEVREFSSRLIRLCLTLNIGITNDIHRRQLSEEEEKILRKLRPPEDSSFDMNRCCLEGTRVDLLQGIDEWTHLTDQCEQLYWIHGVAGCGKSSVAASISAKLDSRKALSGSFFCSRDIPERRSAKRLVHAFVYFLVRTGLPIRDVLLRILKDDSDLLEKPLSTQVKVLLSGLRLECSKPSPSQEVIVVVDALDECANSEDVSSFVVEILKLMPSLKVILTSRPLPRIREILKARGSFRACDLFTVDTYADIVRYAHEEFSKLNTRLPKDFPEDQIVALAQKAEGHFQWITTVLDHISSILPWKKKEVLDEIISSTRSNCSSEEKLDAMYQRVLDDVCEASRQRMDAVKLLIGLVFVTSKNRPLPTDALHAFAPSGIGREDFQNLLQELGSVLTEESQTGAIRACHPSFLDFIENTERAKRYWIDTEILDMNMAERCLDIMVSGLKFNICNLETSHLRNDEIGDLSERINHNVTQQLKYSCLYWLNHLSGSGAHVVRREPIMQKLRCVFCQPTSLYWLEALSLMSELKVAVSSLRDLSRLVKPILMDEELRNATADLYHFVMALYEPMAISSPHIYISALLWTPPESLSAKSHSQKFTSGRLVLGNIDRYWHDALRKTLSLDTGVLSVAYSPDGRRIVSGCRDNAVRIWDAQSGALLGEPLRGHENWVTAVVYRPDGQQILSGSGDGVLRVWDAETGAPVGDPLRGHEGWISSVAYHPGGCHIVSGSSDYTIRIWDAETTKPTGEPLRGHENRVSSVCYSPDGRLIVSGSDDETVRIWDVELGVTIGEPLRGHKDCVTAAVYSPASRHIVSGSGDGTIRIWDAETGALVCQPLLGHESWISSVAYSPDGRFIASGSRDNTLRMWDAETGEPIGDPLLGHVKWVQSIAFSPEGYHIVSGSDDNTIRIWDAETGDAVGEPFSRLEKGINAVMYSPDGRHIVSGSDDRTVRIWDAETGASVGEPLRGHEDVVYCVAYCPDGRRVVSGSSDTTLRIWDVETGTSILKPLRGHKNSVFSVAYAPDGCHIVSGSADCTVRVWDADKCACIRELFQGDRVLSVTYTPDGCHIVSGSVDNGIHIWDARTGELIRQGNTDFRVYQGLTVPASWSPVEDERCWSVACSPDGRHIISGSSNATVTVCDWNTETGQGTLLHVYPHNKCGCYNGITGRLPEDDRHFWSVAYSPDGRHFISSSSCIRIWDTETKSVNKILCGHEGRIKSVAYSPDGRRIASGSDDGTIRVWDPNSDVIARLPREQTTDWLGFSSDGRYITSTIDGDRDETLFTMPPRIPSDGWIRTSSGDLVLWVPHAFRNGVCDMSLYTLPRNAYGRPVKIDWAGLPHGSKWTSVKIED